MREPLWPKFSLEPFAATAVYRLKGKPAMHALLIEDEVLIAMELAIALENLGYVTTEVAATVTEAITAASRRRPDLVTADFNLAKGTGVDAVNRIISQDAMPVLFITSAPDAVLKLLPHANVLSKPFSLSQLAAAVSRAVAAFYGDRSV